MEEKRLKIILNKSGRGNITPRYPIPIDWFKKMGLSEEFYEVDSTFNEKTGELTIRKANITK